MPAQRIRKSSKIGIQAIHGKIRGYVFSVKDRAKGRARQRPAGMGTE